MFLKIHIYKFQIDWYGIAASVYVLIAGKYMKVTKNMVTGLYKPQSNCPRLVNDKGSHSFKNSFSLGWCVKMYQEVYYSSVDKAL